MTNDTSNGRFPFAGNEQAVLKVLRSWFGDSAGISVRHIGGHCPISPEEADCIRSAVISRKEEFSAGRWCAHKALTELGIPAGPILSGVRRAPVWPPNTIGTITHAAQLAVAVVARNASWHGIGIDIVEIATNEDSLAEAGVLIASPDEERRAVLELQGACEARSLLFSAKESTIKAISATLDRFVDFREILVSFEGTSFEASCVGLHATVRGRWRVIDRLILTAAMLP